MIHQFQTEIQRHLSNCDKASTMYHKGKAFEDFICYLFGRIPGITMVRRNEMNVFDTEEIDIVFWNEFLPSGLPSPAFPPIILVECKNWSTRVGSKDVDWFNTKLKNRGLTFGILVAAQDITGDPILKTEARSVISGALKEQRRIIVITREDIEKLAVEDDLVTLLRDKLLELIVQCSNI